MTVNEQEGGIEIEVDQDGGAFLRLGRLGVGVGFVLTDSERRKLARDAYLDTDDDHDEENEFGGISTGRYTIGEK